VEGLCSRASTLVGGLLSQCARAYTCCQVLGSTTPASKKNASISSAASVNDTGARMAGLLMSHQSPSLAPRPSFPSRVAKESEHGERTSISNLSNKGSRAFEQRNGSSGERGNHILQPMLIRTQLHITKTDGRPAVRSRHQGRRPRCIRRPSSPNPIVQCWLQFKPCCVATRNGN
jgi:hypothetical protein